MIFTLLTLLLAPLAYGDATDRIVVITDSHGVGHFGEELALWLRRRPTTKFDFIASGGSAPLQWRNNAFNTTCGFHDASTIAKPLPRVCNKLHTPPLTALWRQQGPPAADERRVSIVVLGTNFGMAAAMYAEQLAATQSLAEDAMNSSDRCLWVGPPNMNHSPGFDTAGVAYKVALIQKALAQAAHKTGKPPCQLIDSRLYSQYPKKGGDGIHLHWPGWKTPETIKASGDWADAIAAQADCLLALPSSFKESTIPAASCGSTP